jgi:hypothetical protein
LPACRASIQYKIKADCDQAGLLKPDFKKTATIEVLQRSKAAGLPEPLALAAEEPISFFCCFKKGVIGLRVDGNSDCFLPGESMALRAQVGVEGHQSAVVTERYMLMWQAYAGTLHRCVVLSVCLATFCCCGLQLDNKSTTDVLAVEFYLHQKLKLTAKTMWGSRDKHFSSTHIHQRCAAALLA